MNPSPFNLLPFPLPFVPTAQPIQFPQPIQYPLPPLPPRRISREEAICIFYKVEYNETNVVDFTNTVNMMEGIEICYIDDPLTPILYPIKSIKENSTHHQYPAFIYPEPLNPQLFSLPLIQPRCNCEDCVALENCINKFRTPPLRNQPPRLN